MKMLQKVEMIYLKVPACFGIARENMIECLD